ncbi:response regulator [Deinococcus misasensis]|uniref:response regulator n=1 Tax=Deinococcus misasensis TaxID=392413 RepID=UPI00054ED50C|nr:response regulator [Deinococcus misasensis]
MNRVLVVDDEQYIGLLIRHILQSHGYEVVVTTCVADALEKLQSEHFNLVFTDLNMPGENGFSLLETIQQQPQHTSVVVITAQGEEEITGQALALGARDLLHKPFSRQSLLKMARKFLAA